MESSLRGQKTDGNQCSRQRKTVQLYFKTGREVEIGKADVCLDINLQRIFFLLHENVVDIYLFFLNGLTKCRYLACHFTVFCGGRKSPKYLFVIIVKGGLILALRHEEGLRG